MGITLESVYKQLRVGGDRVQKFGVLRAAYRITHNTALLFVDYCSIFLITICFYYK